MLKRYLLMACLLGFASFANSQTSPGDTIPVQQDSVMSLEDGFGIDTTIDYDELLNELGDFLDSILRPRSYFLASLSVGQTYLNFVNADSTRLINRVKAVLSPTIGYYSRGGLGLTASAYMFNHGHSLNLYQFLVSPSFDYLKDPDLAAGVAYIRYFTRDSLPFYTSPLQNEVSAYLLLRKPWLQPGIALNYGWGSRTEVTKRVYYLENLGIRVPVTTTSRESVSDFTATASVRHHFYWLDVFSNKDFIRLSPQLSFTGGSQRYGMNQTTGTYNTTRNNTNFNASRTKLDDRLKFQPLALTFYLRTEYSVGKFFIQPQLILDYYFPATDNNFTTLFSLNTGFMF